MIQIIISPAKKMNICEEFPGTATTPVFAEQTDLLYQTLKQMSFEELQKLWKCSEKLALQNTKRLCEFTPADAVTPAVLAYEGIQYQYLAPGIFSDTQWDYVNRHLNILSGFYGVLCPSDAVIPYRLEMQTKLETENATDLYHFWNNQLYQALYCKFEKDSPKELINLASAEYSKAILPYKNIRCITLTSELFQGLPETVSVARYHSLAADEATLPETLKVTARTADGEVMAVEDSEKKIYGVQFHPESILTPQGRQMVENFLKNYKIDHRTAKKERNRI